MTNGEIHHQERVEANIKPFTAEEFNSFLSKRRQEWLEREVGTNPNGHFDVTKYNEFYDRETRKLIDELIKESERFKYVFQTANGSIYFVLETGESQRLKCSQGKFEWSSIQPLLKNLFFVSGSESERILKLIRESYKGYDALLGIPLEEVNLGVGVHPVELNMHHAPKDFDTLLERSGDRIVLKAQKHEWDDHNEPGQISNGIHIGNAVTNIVKGI